jgi:hypothetical protein
MFNTIVTVIQGGFSRAFWFSNFLPLVAVTSLNLAILIAIRPEIGEVCSPDFAGRCAPFGTAALIGLVLAAYVIGPFTPVCLGLLDGSLLPDFLRGHLRIDYVRQARRVRARQHDAKDTYAGFASLAEQGVRELPSQRAAGNRIGRIADVGLITLAETAVRALEKEEAAGRPIPLAMAREATAILGRALSNNACSLQPNHPQAQAAADLDRIQVRLVELLKVRTTEAAEAIAVPRDRDRRTLALADPQPTELGNVRVLTENYPEIVYNIAFNYIWPRLQFVLPKDNPLTERLGMAQAQVNFAVLLFILLSVSVIFWLPLLYWVNVEPKVFMAVGVIGPLLCMLVYRLAVESQIAFGETVRTAIDSFRLDLLKALRQPQPNTLRAERQIWDALSKAEQAGSVFDLTYRFTS